MPSRSETETKLVYNCLQYLKVKGIFAWRNNTGAAKAQYKGKRRFIRYGLKGSSDILGILPDGRFLAIECKRKGTYPTKDQRAFLKQIEANKGVALLVRNIADLIRALEDQGYVEPSGSDHLHPT